MHGPAGCLLPYRRTAWPVPDPVSGAPITTPIDLLTNRLNNGYQLNFQPT
jgi:hypothetical protein